MLTLIEFSDANAGEERRTTVTNRESIRNSCDNVTSHNRHKEFDIRIPSVQVGIGEQGLPSASSLTLSGFILAVIFPILHPESMHLCQMNDCHLDKMTGCRTS